jgi:hypothetical protein
MTLKKYGMPAAVLCAVLLVSGCTTIARRLSAGKITYDDSLAPEESVLVVFAYPIHVLSYNGISVEEAWYPNGKYRINRVTLPAGEMSVNFDLKHVIGNNYYTRTFQGEDIELRFNFEAGKEYTVAPYTKVEGLFGFVKGEFGVAVWNFASSYSEPGDVDRDSDKVLKSWKLGEF